VESRSEPSSGRVDPRLLVIPHRLSSVKEIVAVMSSKGGVGKTLVATLLSLALRDRGLATGLLDLDFTNPSTHIVLGVNPANLEFTEEKGIIPPVVYGVKYLTIAIFTGDKPLPLRGSSVDNVFLELLSITRWGVLDYLVIDTPPGIGDENLNLLSYMGDRADIVLVTTPSKLALKSVERLLTMLHDAGYRVLGVIGNMDSSGLVGGFCKQIGVEYLGSLPFDEGVENALGDVTAIKKTSVWKRVFEISGKIARTAR